MSTTQTPVVSVHGRYLVDRPSEGAPAGVLVGFHGYAESADMQLERLKSIPGAGSWLLVSVQALHRFYRGRTRDVVASWMTRQDRELAIADNNRYIASVVDAVLPAGSAMPVVFGGFSQGVAMAFRAACHSARPVNGVIALGGDVPPELDRRALARIPRVLIGRGVLDELYAEKLWASDQARLREAGVVAAAVSLEGGHEWTPAFSEAVGAFLSGAG